MLARDKHSSLLWKSKIMAVISFMILSPGSLIFVSRARSLLFIEVGANVIKFYSSLMENKNKLHRFVSWKFFKVNVLFASKYIGTYRKWRVPSSDQQDVNVTKLFSSSLTFRQEKEFTLQELQPAKLHMSNCNRQQNSTFMVWCLIKGNESHGTVTEQIENRPKYLYPLWSTFYLFFLFEILTCLFPTACFQLMPFLILPYPPSLTPLICFSLSLSLPCFRLLPTLFLRASVI